MWYQADTRITGEWFEEAGRLARQTRGADFAERLMDAYVDARHRGGEPLLLNLDPYFADWLSGLMFERFGFGLVQVDALPAMEAPTQPEDRVEGRLAPAAGAPETGSESPAMARLRAMTDFSVRGLKAGRCPASAYRVSRWVHAGVMAVVTVVLLVLVPALSRAAGESAEVIADDRSEAIWIWVFLFAPYLLGVVGRGSVRQWVFLGIELLVWVFLATAFTTGSTGEPGQSLLTVMFWLGAAAAIAELAFSSALSTWLRAMTANDQLLDLAFGRRVHGEAAWLLESSNLDPSRVARGASGERRTAVMLQALVDRYPSVHVFHGVPWPTDATDADIDHILVAGPFVLVIDSKAWAPGTYEALSTNLVARNGSPFAGSDVKVEEERRQVRASIVGVVKDVCTSAMVIIQGDSPGSVKVIEHTSPEKLDLQIGEEVEDFLIQVIDQQEIFSRVVDPRILKCIDDWTWRYTMGASPHGLTGRAGRCEQCEKRTRVNCRICIPCAREVHERVLLVRTPDQVERDFRDWLRRGRRPARAGNGSAQSLVDT
jgi:hypothetical protein